MPKKNANVTATLSNDLVGLLTQINEGGDNGAMLTQEQGLEAVNAGFATVDTTVVGDAGTAKVTLTDAGRAALASATGDNSDEMAGATGTTGTGTKFAIKTGFVVPENSARRGRQSSYPFDQLEVGQYFDVAPNAGESNEQVIARLQSSVSGARARFAEETGETRTVRVKQYQRDADGKFVKDADGKRIQTGETTEERPVTKPTRDFKVIANPEGPGARVGRIA